MWVCLTFSHYRIGLWVEGRILQRWSTLLIASYDAVDIWLTVLLVMLPLIPWSRWCLPGFSSAKSLSSPSPAVFIRSQLPSPDYTQGERVRATSWWKEDQGVCGYMLKPQKLINILGKILWVNLDILFLLKVSTATFCVLDWILASAAITRDLWRDLLVAIFLLHWLFGIHL